MQAILIVEFGACDLVGTRPLSDAVGDMVLPIDE